MSFVISTKAFQPSQEIPQKYTCDGSDVSPDLKWDDAPPGTRSYALICDDPDAPSGTFTHWVLYGLSAETTGLGEGFRKDADVDQPKCRQGRNDFGRTGYNGPCPPSGSPHRYYFRLYALDESLNLASNASKSDLQSAMTGHILAQTEVMGTYQRKKR